MENPKHSFSKTNCVLQLILESQIKSKTVMSWSLRKKRKKRDFFVLFILSEGNICFIPMYSVLNKLSEYIYFYIWRNITSFFFVACLIVKNLHCILKHSACIISTLLADIEQIDFFHHWCTFACHGTIELIILIIFQQLYWC